MTISTDGTAMAKVQKTFLIDEDLAHLIDKVLELSGMNFTKFATAALLHDLFDRCAHPDIGPIIGPDAMWISLASRLERGTLKVGSIPTELMKNAIYMVKANLDDPDHHRDGDKPGWIAIQKRLLRDYENHMKWWQAAVEEKNGELPAALEIIGECFGR